MAEIKVDADITLWLRNEPFSVGALPGPPARLTITNIKKIVPYAKTKGKAGFPNLSYSVWRHVGCNKLQLSEDVAWSYFYTFQMIHGQNSEQLMELDRKTGKAFDQHSVDSFRLQLSVPCLKFVLFLYIQHIHKISLRASLVSGSDEWPLRARSPDPESRSVGASKELDENSSLTFVLNNLNEILELLIEPEQKSDASTGRGDFLIGFDSIEAIDFLVEGSINNKRHIRPLSEIALVHLKSGSSKVSKSFSFRSLQSWLKSCLSQNPFGVTECIAHGRQLCWPMAGESKDAWIEKKRGRIATNAPFAPKDLVKGYKMIVISQMNKMTVARSSATVKGSTVKIHRCRDAFVYLLSPLRSVSIEKCQRCTIALGPVELSVDLVRCEQVTVVAVCRRFTTVASKLCAIHVRTPHRPLVFGGNESLVFGPYHTFYPKLEEHMAEVGLSALPDQWDKPLYMDAHSSAATDQSEENNNIGGWDLQNPSAFYTFTIPFDMEGDTQTIPGGLPARYLKSLGSRRQQIASLQNLIASSGMNSDQNIAFHAIVNSRFQEWLQMTGNERQLEGLASGSKIT